MLDGEHLIIKNAVRGEASAFGLLYDHYQPKIYRFVLIKVSHREEAEDLTHQVFLHAWQNIRRYEDLGFPFSSWLYQIARNQIIDHYRTKKRALRIEDLADAEIPPLEHSLTDMADERRALDEVHRALRKLPADYQDVILMRFVEDLSLKDTAAALGKSEGAVKLLQHRAVRALRAKINSNGTD